MMPHELSDRLKEIELKIADVCRTCGRQSSEITIVAVTKTFPPETVEEALRAGLTHIGENRIQEAERKVEVIRERGSFHLIGNLQSNKVKKAVSMFDWIQTIDDYDIAFEISKRAVEQGRKVQVLIEVNSSGESQKHGAEPDEVLKIAERVMSLPQLTLRGLMTVGPLTDDVAAIQRAFGETFLQFTKLQKLCGKQIDTLSMGMSDDYELAIREGSTMIRLGSVLFGRRKTV
jgi:pyridoxal phosphate enzyme (YggS family)